MAGDYDLTAPGGRAMARTMVTFARMEVEVKSERQQSAERQRAESGKARGGVRPFGYEQDGMTVHPVEGPALAAAIRAVTAGASQKAIMREWMDAGLRPVRGGDWQVSSFNALLRRPRNAGLSQYRGRWSVLVSGSRWCRWANMRRFSLCWRTRPGAPPVSGGSGCSEHRYVRCVRGEA